MKIISKIKTTKEAIVETIAFFDLFSYPPTLTEILKHLKVKSSYLELVEILEELILNNIIESKEGLFFLQEREVLVEERKKRYNYSDRKYKIAIKVTKLFSFVPWVRLVCVANLIGQDNMRDASDIDLFIVSDKNRLWVTRFFVVLIAKFLNVRPQKNNAKDKICLSFFVSEDSLNLEKIKNDENDMYFEYWLLNLSPIYDKNSSYNKFWRENNSISEKYPNFYRQIISSRRKIKEQKNSFYKKNWELFFGGLENRLKNIQKKIIFINLKKNKVDSNGVVIRDNIIKLHLVDRRKDFLNKLNENVSKIISRNEL